LSKEYLHIKATEIPLYRSKLIIVLTNSKDKLSKYLPDFALENDAIYGHAWMDNYKGFQGFYMILNFDNPYRDLKHGCIAHEAMHLVHYLAEERGFQSDFNNDEPLTYLIEWITDEAYKFINKHKFKFKS